MINEKDIYKEIENIYKKLNKELIDEKDRYKEIQNIYDNLNKDLINEKEKSKSIENILKMKENENEQLKKNNCGI